MKYQIIKNNKIAGVIDDNLDYKTKNIYLKNTLNEIRKNGVIKYYSIPVKDPDTCIMAIKYIKKKGPLFMRLLSDELFRKGFFIEEAVMVTRRFHNKTTPAGV